MLREIY
jgi:hypothetical protein